MAGNFFSVSSDIINLIAAQTQWEDALLGYLVLAKHVQPKARTTIAGAPAIFNKLGISAHRANKIIATLKTVSYGDQAHEVAVVDYPTWIRSMGHEVAKPSSRHPVKVLPHFGDSRIYLPNSLVDGVGTGKTAPPLMRLLRLQPKQDRLDTICLLLKLYEEHSYLDYGGVNPQLVRREWVYSGELLQGRELGYLGSGPSRNNIIHFWAVEPSHNWPLAGKELSNSLLDGKQDRFCKAFHHLNDLHLLYEVATVFDDNPIVNSGAEPLYPLYVWDQSIRERAKVENSGLGGLYSEAFNCLSRSGVVNGQFNVDTFTSAGATPRSGFFVYASDSRNAHLVSVFRLKYLPHTKDTGAGFLAEALRTAHWKRTFTEARF